MEYTKRKEKDWADYSKYCRLKELDEKKFQKASWDNPNRIFDLK